MADTYLPADVRKRIVDVMRERKMTQRELALRIDVNESTISRFLIGNLILYRNRINGNHAAICKFQLHTGSIHIELTRK